MPIYKVWLQVEQHPEIKGECKTIVDEEVYVTYSRKAAMTVKEALIFLMSAFQNDSDAVDIFHQLERLAKTVVQDQKALAETEKEVPVEPAAEAPAEPTITDELAEMLQKCFTQFWYRDACNYHGDSAMTAEIRAVLAKVGIEPEEWRSTAAK